VLVCDDGRIKLTDFGIARSTADQTMTATGLLLGSPAYIAPEVASGVPAGPISDAWSLGGLLFATTEGRPPFDQGTAIATLTSVVKDPVPPHPHSGRLGAVVSGLLMKTPALRMRIDRALVIMRSIADDPSGTNLAAVHRIPRDAPSGTAAPAGAAQQSGSSPYPAGPQQGGGSQNTWQPAGGPQQGSRTQGGGQLQSPGTQQGSGTAPGAGSGHSAPRHQPRRPAPFQAAVDQPGTGPDRSSSTQSHRPSSAARLPSSPPFPISTAPTDSAGASGILRDLPATSPADASTYPPGAALPWVAGQRTPASGGPPAADPLPPPPWAQSESATLAPLPAAAVEPAGRRRLIAAIIAAVIAAVIGFFGVRIIADLATDDAAPAASSVSTLQG
jgi:serine/threonine protein kinase